MSIISKTLIAVTMVAIALSCPFAATAAQLDAGEEAHLIFMREEEKLARDVYLTLGAMYPKNPIFINIAEGAEQSHTNTMLAKLEQFGIEDPNPDTNNLPDSIGVFTGADYGWYFAEKFALLTEMGAQSKLDALYVGAFIEELDMLDIVDCPKVIVETDNGVGVGECGLSYTDEKALILSLSSLVAGSESHLRAYVGQIEVIIGEGNYVAQVLPQEVVDAILGR